MNRPQPPAPRTPAGHRRRARLPLALALALALLGAACGDDGPTTTTAGGAAAGGDATFPVTVESDDGPVEVPARPERIVSLSASLTEVLYAIDAGDQVEAVDAYSNFPEGTPMTDLSAFQPNVEAIAGYDPDLVVLSSDDDDESVEAIRALDVPTVVLGAAETLDDVDRQIRTLGDATGHPDEAADLVERLDAEIDEILADVPERAEPLTYYFEVSDSFHSVTSDTFIGEVLALAGLRSIADGVDDTAGGYPQLTAEAIVDADPDLILVARSGEGVTVDDITGRSGWETMSAVRDRRIELLDADVATRWGPRIVELLRRVVDVTAEG